MQSRKEWEEGTGLATALLALPYLRTFCPLPVATHDAQRVPGHVRSKQRRGLARSDHLVRGCAGDSRTCAPPHGCDFRMDRDRLLRVAQPRNEPLVGLAAVFSLEAVLLLVAGVARSALVIRPRRDLPSLLGAAFIGYALIV